MTASRQNQPRPDPPEGGAFLDAIAGSCGRVLQQSNVILNHDLNGTRDALGTLLSLLDRATCCWWGCRGGDHVAEQFVARCCQNAEAAFFLAQSGFYDQSLSLSRSNMESANLCILFVADPSDFEKWRQADVRTRGRTYSPAKVRQLLADRSLPTPISKDQYALLCEKATHPSPKLPPGMYNVAGRPMVAGYFQPVGLGMALHQLAYPMVFVGLCAPDLLVIQGENAQRIHDAAKALSAASVRLDEYWTTLYAERLRGNDEPARGDSQAGPR